MAKTREQLIDWLVEDSADTCRQDEGYMRSILREYWGGMTAEELECSYRELAHHDGQDDRGRSAAAPAPSVSLRFRPQAWVNDYAISVDREDPDTWKVPQQLLLERFPSEQDWHDRDNDRDDMRFEGTAPKWVRDWPGPFEVELAEDEPDPWASRATKTGEDHVD